MKQIRKYSIEQVKPGMKLSSPIMNDFGAIRICDMVILTEKLIERLKRDGVEFVTIVESKENEVPNLTTKVNIVVKYQEIVSSVKYLFQKAHEIKQVDIDQIHEVVHGAIKPLIETPGIINYLKMLQNKDDYTFNHSVNVAIICGILGKWLNYDNISELVIAGLMHDLGKIKIPLSILNKPGKLTHEEMEVIKKHTILGWEISSRSSEISRCILDGIIQHHERLDGSGYPFGISGNMISYIGRIVAIADLYDAMTTNRVYRCARTPFCVLDVLSTEMFNTLDPRICKVFIDNIKDCLVGSKVRLNNEIEAQVISFDRTRHVKPIVKTFENQYFDLVDTDLSIVEVISF